jgi:hypothetical protein
MLTFPLTRCTLAVPREFSRYGGETGRPDALFFSSAALQAAIECGLSEVACALVMRLEAILINSLVVRGTMTAIAYTSCAWQHGRPVLSYCFWFNELSILVVRMSQPIANYKNHRIPPEIVARAVWLYYRFPLSLRHVEEMLLERGIVVSYETIRRWGRRHGPDYAAA